MPELIVIMVVALIIFGPRKLPEIGKAIGKGINEFRRASLEMEKQVKMEFSEAEKEKQKTEDSEKETETKSEEA